MDYISTVEASKKWGITANRITILCNEGRIDGAIQIGMRWMIPKDKEKPLDYRIKNNKENKDVFRFPLFSGRKIDSFNPPLTPEEMQIKKVEDCFFACKYVDAYKELGNLYETSNNIYIKIFALYFECMVSVTLNMPDNFYDCFGKLTNIFNYEFKYKKEMFFIYEELKASIGIGDFFSNSYVIDCNYKYHESMLSHLCALSTLSLFYSGNKRITPDFLTSYEINSMLLDKTNNPIDSLTVHIYLGFAYASIGNKEKSACHYKKSLEISKDNELYWLPALEYFYVGKYMDNALSYFDNEFVVLIKKLSSDLHDRHIRFVNNKSGEHIFNSISKNQFMYYYYATKGFSNKEVANFLNVSEKTVSNTYSNIYSTIGVRSKNELVAYYESSMKKMC